MSFKPKGLRCSLTADCLIGNGDLPVTVTLFYDDYGYPSDKPGIVMCGDVNIADGMTDAQWTDIERSFETRWFSIVDANMEAAA